jgi:hypothetical protein
MLVFNKYFYKNKKSKLYFGDRVVVLNDLFYGYGWSILTKKFDRNGGSTSMSRSTNVPPSLPPGTSMLPPSAHKGGCSRLHDNVRVATTRIPPRDVC